MTAKYASLIAVGRSRTWSAAMTSSAAFGPSDAAVFEERAYRGAGCAADADAVPVTGGDDMDTVARMAVGTVEPYGTTMSKS
jgi:hypothetical protein